MYIYTCTCVNIYMKCIHMRIFTCRWRRRSKGIYICKCIYICMYLCIYTCVSIYMICTYVCMYILVDDGGGRIEKGVVHTLQIIARRLLGCACVTSCRVCICVYIYTYIYIYIHICIHTCTHIGMHKCIRT